jgi:hypothetical protein
MHEMINNNIETGVAVKSKDKRSWCYRAILVIYHIIDILIMDSAYYICRFVEFFINNINKSSY